METAPALRVDVFADRQRRAGRRRRRSLRSQHGQQRPHDTAYTRLDRGYTAVVGYIAGEITDRVTERHKGRCDLVNLEVKTPVSYQ